MYEVIRTYGDRRFLKLPEHEFKMSHDVLSSLDKEIGDEMWENLEQAALEFQQKVSDLIKVAHLKYDLKQQ
jgi:hypothetical protein|tara:strand:+ start:146 stop:358 length:213 start_codon:yes stop_codon:yes gene_type:complete